MDVVLLIGIPASGKSTFYKERFVDTHVRINRDMLNTKNREQKLFQFCVKTEQPCVIDNTNVQKSDRAYFIQQAPAHSRVIGYYFESKIEDCYDRNQARKGQAIVPDVALYSKIKLLERPSLDEGFSELYFVKLIDQGFDVCKYLSF